MRGGVDNFDHTVMDGDEDEDQLVKLWGSVSVGMFYTAVARFIMYPSVNKELQR